MNSFDKYKEIICSNCKADCKKAILVIHDKDLKIIKCCNYKPKQKFKGYKDPLKRTARQLGALMGFTQEY